MADIRQHLKDFCLAPAPQVAISMPSDTMKVRYGSNNLSFIENISQSCRDQLLCGHLGTDNLWVRGNTVHQIRGLCEKITHAIWNNTFDDVAVGQMLSISKLMPEIVNFYEQRANNLSQAAAQTLRELQRDYRQFNKCLQEQRWDKLLDYFQSKLVSGAKATTEIPVKRGNIYPLARRWYVRIVKEEICASMKQGYNHGSTFGWLGRPARFVRQEAHYQLLMSEHKTTSDIIGPSHKMCAQLQTIFVTVLDPLPANVAHFYGTRRVQGLHR